MTGFHTLWGSTIISRKQQCRASRIKSAKQAVDVPAACCARYCLPPPARLRHHHEPIVLIQQQQQQQQQQRHSVRTVTQCTYELVLGVDVGDAFCRACVLYFLHSKGSGAPPTAIATGWRSRNASERSTALAVYQMTRFSRRRRTW